MRGQGLTCARSHKELGWSWEMHTALLALESGSCPPPWVQRVPARVSIDAMDSNYYLSWVRVAVGSPRFQGNHAECSFPSLSFLTPAPQLPCFPCIPGPVTAWVDSE